MNILKELKGRLKYEKQCCVIESQMNYDVCMSNTTNNVTTQNDVVIACDDPKLDVYDWKFDNNSNNLVCKHLTQSKPYYVTIRYKK